MSTASAGIDRSPTSSRVELSALVERACDRIAPSWPLDRSIAVNPYQGWSDRPIEAAAARLGVLSGARLTMPRAWFVQRWRDGRLDRRSLEAACAERHAGGVEFATVLRAVDGATAGDDTGRPVRLPLVADLRDSLDPPAFMAGWPELVVHQIGQHGASFFDDGLQSRWRAPASASSDYYRSWRDALVGDRGIPWQAGRALARRRIEALETDPLAAIAASLDALGVPHASRLDYATALLLSVNGWAAWCAWRRWQARLAGNDDPTLVELLAVRLAWERLLADDAPAPLPGDAWRQRWGEVEAAADRLEAAQRIDWTLQAAAEHAYRRPLAEALGRTSVLAPAATTGDDTTTWAQAVFCIDVRSEVFRRALETADAGIATRGFAGFFGLPIAYRPAGADLIRPQLPGLLAPSLEVREAIGEQGGVPLAEAIARRRRVVRERRVWSELGRRASSIFGYVETLGLAYGAKLLAASGPAGRADDERWEDTGLARAARRPRPVLGLPDPAEAARLVRGILHAMGLERDFAPLVMLVGHGSRSTNNPHAAGLDCGACGGQTGEVNARVLAGLLNDPEVRRELAALGLELSAATVFVPALHDTTTDDLRCFDTAGLPPAAAAALARLEAAAATAGDRARRERAPALGIDPAGSDLERLADRFRARAGDGSELRPEWGLAGNAAFVVAPRARTRGLALDGRVFLHDYDFRDDADRSVLTGILTAPMIVTHWINLQYHASTVDPQRYGSGNKVLHNVVDGHLGVFEGNGGDLRIGLPLQSVHDGRDWRHTPLRLAVAVQAPRAALEAVLAANPDVRRLFDHRWLTLLRLDDAPGCVETWVDGEWSPSAVTEAASPPVALPLPDQASR